MRIVCISDTHSRHDAMQIPDGDLLLHAGDATKRGGRAEIEAFDAWLSTLPHRHKVVIAGNHDFGFQKHPDEAPGWITAAHYLQDQALEIEGLRIWGSPWQPWFFDWAFNLERGAPLRAKWDLIPADTDVLLTHGPPHQILDRTIRGEHVGCEELRIAVERIRPRLHVFGHIHEAYGQLVVDGTYFVNASSCTLRYTATQAPVVVDL